MKNKKVKKGIFYVFSFILSAAVIIGSGFYRKALSKESISFKVNLNGKEAKPVVFDIAEEGLPKKLAQPGKVSISTGHGEGVINNAKEAVLVQVKAENFIGDVHIDSSDVSFNKGNGSFAKSLAPGQGLNLSITLDIPREYINKALVSSGDLLFVNTKNGSLLAKLPIKVVNSNIK